MPLKRPLTHDRNKSKVNWRVMNAVHTMKEAIIQWEAQVLETSKNLYA